MVILIVGLIWIGLIMFIIPFFVIAKNSDENAKRQIEEWEKEK